MNAFLVIKSKVIGDEGIEGMQSEGDKQSPPVIEVHRPTGPRITLAEEKSLGELVVHKAKELAETGAKLVVTTTKQHKAVTTIAASTLLAIAVHFIMAMLLSSSQKVSVRPYVVGRAATHFQVPTGEAPFTPSCAESTVFLARTSGLTNTYSQAYDTMICGMVTDGLINGNMGSTGCGSKIDIMYVLATDTTTTANMNLCGTSYSLTANGSPTFAANGGYTGDGSSAYLETGYDIASHGNTCGNGAANCSYALSNAHTTAYIVNNRTTFQVTAIFGALNSGSFGCISRLVPYTDIISGDTAFGSVNSNESQNMVMTGTTSPRGFWVLATIGGSRTMRLYNGSVTDQAGGTGEAAFLTSVTMVLLAQKDTQSGVNAWTNDTLAFFSLGGAISSGDRDLYSARVNQFMIDVGAPFSY